MQTVNIYIYVKFKGRLESGTSQYGIILEYLKENIPYTREYTKGYTNTTRNRAGILACIEGLKYLVRPCTVNLTINSRFIHNAISQEWYKRWIEEGNNKKGEPANNLDLWEELSSLIKHHELATKYEPRSTYTPYMRTMLTKKEVEYKEDKNNV